MLEELWRWGEELCLEILILSPLNKETMNRDVSDFCNLYNTSVAMAERNLGNRFYWMTDLCSKVHFSFKELKDFDTLN